MDDDEPKLLFSAELEKKSPNKLMGWQKRRFHVQPGKVSYTKPGKDGVLTSLDKADLVRLEVDPKARVCRIHTKTERGVYELRCNDPSRLREFQKAMVAAFPKLARDGLLERPSSGSVVSALTPAEQTAEMLTASLPVGSIAAACVSPHSVEEEPHPAHPLQGEGASASNAVAADTPAVPKREGLCVEYYEGRGQRGPRKFEGQFRSGLRHGRGMEFEENGNKLFEGFWLDGEREEGCLYKNKQVWLEGTWKGGELVVGQEYNLVGGATYLKCLSVAFPPIAHVTEAAPAKAQTKVMKYQGQWQDGLWHGIGTCFFEDGGKRHEGGWQCGEWHGDGVLYYQKGSVLYRGQFDQGECSGVGTCYLDCGAKRYSGQWHEGDRHGEGTLYNGIGVMIYHGQWVNNKEHGHGVIFDDAGGANAQVSAASRRTSVGSRPSVQNAEWHHDKANVLFEGELADGERSHGVSFKGGEITYEGQWDNILRHGQGKEFSLSAVVYEGEWAKDMRHGHGVEYDERGGKAYVGQWANGKCEGYGTAYGESEAPVFEGYWRDGRRHGHGTEYDLCGAVRCEGEWVEGRRPSDPRALRRRDRLLQCVEHYWTAVKDAVKAKMVDAKPAPGK